jgi:hypothetical protein
VLRNVVQPAFEAETAVSKVWVMDMVAAFAGWTATERNTAVIAAAMAVASELRMVMS